MAKLTPEDRAKELVTCSCAPTYGRPGYSTDCGCEERIAKISAAIRAAVEEEREEIAKMVDRREYWRRVLANLKEEGTDFGSDIATHRSIEDFHIAREIRARGKS